MATIGANALTLADWAKRLDPDGKVPMVVELLSQTNQMLDDMLFVEGNLPTGHRTTVRTGLPSVSWRRLNEGVAPSKSTTAQVDEQCGMLDVAELNGNTAEFRLSEASAFIEAMSQEMQSTMIYGNASTAPEEFNGLAQRYAALGQNCISGSGSGSDNSSIYLCLWGGQTVHGLFPKGSKAGLQHEDLGLVTVETTAGVAGNRMRAYQDHWQWKCGLSVRDWRYVVRIANIDISNLVAKSSAADLIELMIRAIHRIPNLGAGRAAFYMNRTVFQMLDIQRRDDLITGGGLVYADVDGKVVPTFRGIPIRIVDALLETEATVS
jgi:hypothetical protein